MPASVNPVYFAMFSYSSIVYQPDPLSIHTIPADRGLSIISALLKWDYVRQRPWVLSVPYMTLRLNNA